ncbi:MAG TPA: hypothetical protein VLB90_10515 [Pseudomonadales bacterium]|nr:hypothetical protein [Pseudomonadales bacterium]
MNAADIELARMIYLASSLAIWLFTSMILRGLWRPLRFVLLAITVSILFTPFFVEQAMPDGSNQNVVPAFIVMAHNGISDRDHWQEAIQRAGKPVVVVSGITSSLALLLAMLLPKPKKPVKKPVKKQTELLKEPSLKNENLSKKETPPQTGKPPKTGKSSRKKKYKKQKKNPYLPDDFQPQ